MLKIFPPVNDFMLEYIYENIILLDISIDQIDLVKIGRVNLLDCFLIRLFEPEQEF